MKCTLINLTIRHLDACSISCTNNFHMNLRDTMNIKTDINTCFITILPEDRATNTLMNCCKIRIDSPHSQQALEKTRSTKQTMTRKTRRVVIDKVFYRLYTIVGIVKFKTCNKHEFGRV